MNYEDIPELAKKLVAIQNKQKNQEVVKCLVVQIDRFTLFLFGEYEAFSKNTSTLLEGKIENIGSGYSVRFDPPHGDQGKHHVHVCRRGNELFSLNLDGTRHHGSSFGEQIPGPVADWLSANTKIQIPANRIIECIPPERVRKLILG